MTKYTGPFQDKNIPSKGTASTMTHSTCCKAEVNIIYAETDTGKVLTGYECSKCKKFYSYLTPPPAKTPNYDIYMDDLKKKLPTPPPVPSEIDFVGKVESNLCETCGGVLGRHTYAGIKYCYCKPSEIEGEIEKILEHRFFRKGDNDIWDYAGAKKDLIALYTHHTDEKVKERLEKIKEDLVMHKENVLWRRDEKVKGLTVREMYDAKYIDSLFATAQAAEGEGI